MARNKAWLGEAWLGAARHGVSKARNTARHGEEHGSAWQGWAGPGEVRQGKVQGRTHKIRGGNKLWRDTK